MLSSEIRFCSFSDCVARLQARIVFGRRVVISHTAKLVMHLVYWQLDMKGYCIKMNIHHGNRKN